MPSAPLQPTYDRRWLAVPVALLLGLGLIVWLAVFAGGIDTVAPALDAPAAGDISGVQAAASAISLARHIVEGKDGLLAGPPEQVSARLDGRGTAQQWTVLIIGPVRARPNTAGEFVFNPGEIVIQVSAKSGELSGVFSAGRGVLNGLDIRPDGFVPVPLSAVWPPE